MSNDTVMTSKRGSAHDVTLMPAVAPRAPQQPNASAVSEPESALAVPPDAISERDMQADVTEAMTVGGVWFAAFVTGLSGVRLVCDVNPEGWPIPPGYDLVLLGTAPLPGESGFNLIRVTDQRSAPAPAREPARA
jgi:hypothetical protein